MVRTLFRSFDRIVTSDDHDRELDGADILVDDGVVAELGVGLQPAICDQIVDCSGLLALPGLINAHQHLYQGAMRAIPDLERSLIGDWLRGIGADALTRFEHGRFGAQEVRAIARAVLAESLLGGITTVADQHYFFPGSAVPAPAYVEATIEAASALGIRLTACRGSITMGRAAGGAAPDSMVQAVDTVVAHCESLIDGYHDASPYSMTQIAVAPCGVHVDRPELFEELAALAFDREGVGLHTHLYERIDTDFTRERYGMTPWEFLVEHGWATERTWLAHMTDVPIEELPEIAAAGVAIAHLPAPDLRMGWGRAPLRAMLDAGITLGMGTTGSASNDGANLLGDLRIAALVHRDERVPPDAWPSARELVWAATRGSATCLGRPALGWIGPGSAADFAAWDLHTVDRFGIQDPVAGLLLTGLSSAASLVVVAGRTVVEGGAPVGFDPARIATEAWSVLGVDR